MTERGQLTEIGKTEVEDQTNKWLLLEFQENFIQLRDRDEHILGMTKFFATLILSVATVIVSLLGLKNFVVSPRWIGLLMITTAVVGEILFLWMVTFRSYFVVSAQQLNAIRQHFVRRMPEELRWVAVQPTSPLYPSVFRWGSSVTAIWTLIVFLVMSLLGAGWFAFFHGVGTPEPNAAASSISIALAALLSNAALVVHRAQPRAVLVVDIDNTVVSDIPRKLVLLKELFGKEVTAENLAGNYDLTGILGKEEHAQLARAFQSPDLAALDSPVEGSIAALRRLARRFTIVYLTSRPEPMRAATVLQLRKLGFPLDKPSKSHLIMKEHEGGESTSWKQRKLVTLTARNNVVAGIGDAPSDCIAYTKAGLLAICKQSYWTPEQIRSKMGDLASNVQFASTWEEIEKILTSMVS